VDGDGYGDIVTGSGTGGTGHVQVFSGKTNALIHSFFAFDPGTRSGVSVGALDTTGTGRASLVVGVSGGEPGTVMLFDGGSLAETDLFISFDAGLLDGVFVG
jgi:hypothetical protein